MINIELFQDSSGGHVWDELLLKAQDYTIFQSYGWGEYKRLTGWNPLRYVVYCNNGKVVGMVQLLLKTLPFGFGIAWAPGGPVCCFGGNGGGKCSEILKGLLAYIHHRYPRVLVRFQSLIPSEPLFAYSFNQTCRQPLVKINSGFTILMDLSQVGDGVVGMATAKHRYYIKKAKSTLLDWRYGSSNEDITALISVHKEMVENKKMQSLAINEKEIQRLRNALGDKGVTILTGYLENAPVTSCMTYNIGNKAFYMVAATGRKGREVFAAYAMVVELIGVLKKLDINALDFGGIDPSAPSAEGVNHFKRGFGGTITEYVGEWECSPSEIIRICFNIAIKMRRGRL
jgi:peptidoglycan pentaglycine glycine transferase (the first glycine)